MCDGYSINKAFLGNADSPFHGLTIPGELWHCSSLKLFTRISVQTMALNVAFFPAWLEQPSTFSSPFLQDFSEELSAFSSFLTSSLFGLLSSSLYWTGLTKVPNNSYIVQSSGWFSILVTLDPPAAFDSTLPGFLPCGPKPSLPVPSCLLPLYLVLMLPLLLESKLWAWFLGPHFSYFTDCCCCC